MCLDMCDMCVHQKDDEQYIKACICWHCSDVSFTFPCGRRVVWQRVMLQLLLRGNDWQQCALHLKQPTPQLAGYAQFSQELPQPGVDVIPPAMRQLEEGKLAAPPNGTLKGILRSLLLQNTVSRIIKHRIQICNILQYIGQTSLTGHKPCELNITKHHQAHLRVA